ncbi:MAG: hypothetical protein OCD76_04060 [Reichenbachiella sp.]
MKIAKGIFLFLILLFPVLIYLFLQGFGDNQFNIPVYYQSGLDTTIVECGAIKTFGQYTVDKMSVDEPREDGVVLYDMFGLLTKGDVYTRNNLLSYLEKFKRDSRVNLLTVNSDSSRMKKLTHYNYLFERELSGTVLNEFARCGLVLNGDVVNQIVLVDSKRRIRGYFDPRELEEIDRLNTEVYILLEEDEK